ncbi:acetylglutamate kinase [Subsaximicrobium wynnwilliamsii]|uniref:Acetylglutamate kinase n=1 Tax=Subsaximicrobium wynnwilliamsii TaxID=291179 RepID=A0A5C6ZL90_9FLAO|nr:acetylglutamate kinase [Subsaximicrobium wynnwilliamsii]TXD85446.1 acetylglutamate kinase [Subsaximicrobium wynnwilliamsii]TXD90799.1 acetylglutamate kinase [Subsaximicrobium wynnwilliamsii]TXE05306.1 acetylglutamate kinase [Subsaximicrobium wynnwilliamsii]
MKTLKIIKIGGNIIDDASSLSAFIELFAKLEGPKILIHGGGKLATKLATDLGMEVNMIDGRRVTNAATLDIITMVYAGKINKNIVVQLQAKHCNAIGFSGADGNTIVSKKRPATPIDYGFAGDIAQVNTAVLEVLLTQGVAPVFCALTHDQNGQLLNTNADTIASELAIAFANTYETELYYCFEKNGVLRDVDDETSVIKHISTENYQDLMQQRIISEGMLPKLLNCIYAIQKNVNKVCIGKPEMLSNPNANFTTITK